MTYSNYNNNRRKNQSNSPKINQKIHFPKIRVIDTEGEQIGILTPKEALKIAVERELDLVLVNETSDPPVCRIMNYSKYKFEQKKKAKELKKKQHKVSLKEVKMRYKIDEHDYQVRVNQAERFIKSGDNVKVSVNFKGRENQHTKLGYELLNRMAKDLEDIADVQQKPKKEGRNLIMFLVQKKSSS